MAPKYKPPIITVDGVVCQPSRSAKSTWDDLLKVGVNPGWPDSISFLVRVTVGETQEEAVQRHAKFAALKARAEAERIAGALTRVCTDACSVRI